MAAILKIAFALQEKKKCTIGELFGEHCGNKVKRKLDNEDSECLQLTQLDELDNDISNYFNTTQKSCVNVALTERWMIKRNLKNEVPDNSSICSKHRDFYGSKNRIRSCKCMYPGHVESKCKMKVNLMTLPAVLQTEQLFSSAVQKMVLPFGASWCNNCMIRLHLSNWDDWISKNQHSTCEVCYMDYFDDRYIK